MHLPVQVLHQAVDLYLQVAYPTGVPQLVAQRIASVQALPDVGEVPLDLLERSVPDAACSYALRLGQPLYPHMKLVVDPVPAGTCRGQDFLMRVDVHDLHLHAPPGSPDAAWLAGLRQSNKELKDQIEAAWTAAGLPSFKEFLRQQLEERKRTGAREGEKVR
jgi:hypothetical protein